MAAHDFPVTFGAWLKQRRRALDATQDEIARRAGCTVFTLRKIESGERRPSKQLAQLLAAALEIPEEDRPAFIRVARGELALGRLLRSGQNAVSPIQRDAVQPAPSPPASRIPRQATPLIGRDAELAALQRLFADAQCRLLTLTGIGGIGKTHLAIAFAERQSAEFPGGVFYIPLAPVNSPDQVVTALADVLDFGFSGPLDPQEQLLGYMAEHIRQAALFVLDNLEHLLVPPATPDGHGVAEFVAEILRRLPFARVLVTSRERLALHGEWTYELYGLAVPPGDLATVARLEDYAAAALFVKCARRIRADFQIDADERDALVRICRLVAGVPLAIELAAAWAGMLPCREIAQEIQTNMDFLTGSMRDMPERHRSLRATFDHSWALLSDDERAVLSRLSVFHGGFDRQAAEQVAGATLPLLASLSAKSLVRRAGDVRYDLHEVIRRYALAHLREDRLETHARHGAYYLARVARCEKALKSAAQQDAVRQLAGESDNLYAAWSWAIEQRQFALLGDAARAFGWYFEIAGLYREGLDQFTALEQALRGAAPGRVEQRLLGLVYIHQALLYFRNGRFDRAQPLYETAIAVLRPLEEYALLADALIFLGIMLHLNGDYRRAELLMDEGLAMARECDEPWFEAFAVYNVGYLAGLRGRHAEGYARMQAGLDIWHRLGDPQSIALGLNYLAPVLNHLGRYAEARAALHESIALCAQAKNRWGMGTAYRFLGMTDIAAGQYGEAQAHLRKSLEIFGSYFVGWDIARSLAYLGDALRLSGEAGDAREHYRDALRLARETQALPIALDALAGLSHLQAQDGHTERALALCYFVCDHTASADGTRHDADRLRAALEARLAPERVAAARERAHATTMDAAIALALEDAPG